MKNVFKKLRHLEYGNANGNIFFKWLNNIMFFMILGNKIHFMFYFFVIKKYVYIIWLTSSFLTLKIKPNNLEV